MQEFAQSLSPEVSLTMIREGAGWRFRYWSRCTDDAVLPAPSTIACARTFASPTAGGAFFRALILKGAVPSVREMILLAHDAALLKAALVERADGLDERWQAAMSKVAGDGERVGR